MPFSGDSCGGPCGALKRGCSGACLDGVVCTERASDACRIELDSERRARIRLIADSLRSNGSHFKVQISSELPHMAMTAKRHHSRSFGVDARIVNADAIYHAADFYLNYDTIWSENAVFLFFPEVPKSAAK
jgi:hypothetical protein